MKRRVKISIISLNIKEDFQWVLQSALFNLNFITCILLYITFYDFLPTFILFCFYSLEINLNSSKSTQIGNKLNML